MKSAQRVLAGVALVTGSVACADVYQGSGFTIPDNVQAGVSSVIEVSGGTSAITGVEVTLLGMTHTWIGDLNATLTSPRGTVFPLFIRIGLPTGGGAGFSTDLNGDYRFTDAASTTFWSAASPVVSVVPSGDYRTTGPRVNLATSLNAAFGGQDSNGSWTLRMSDNAGADLGRLQGWTLSIVPTPGSLAIFGLAGIAAGRRRR
jgi:subtilisin-like proprotein convertase family protein